ncbi:glycosyltransferase family 4 protein [Streptomyces sp. BI20]|uniref:glycosyltransferase family 4 protein n=1 Tax=Streptomyces sp. BI20 TaxID=3403460 RepID=UPI003C75B028
MSSTPVPDQPFGRPPLRTVQVFGDTDADSAGHVRSLAGGLAARGVRVTVCAPVAAEGAHDFTGAGVRFAPASVAALRAACAGADLVHAHGTAAAGRAALAVRGLRLPLVVTWHGEPEDTGPWRHLTRVIERRVARAAAVVLGGSAHQVDRARERGARDARLAPAGLPADPATPTRDPDKTRAELGVTGRPLILSVGGPEPHRDHHLLLDAARAWRALDPTPLVLVVGEGPRRQGLARRIETEGLPVRLLGRRPDLPDLLAAADLAVQPENSPARSLPAQAALRAGVPLVAAGDGAMPELVGTAALLVPHGDAHALADAVTDLLADPARRTALAAAGRAQAETWPTEDDTVAQVLAVYDELVERRR